MAEINPPITTVANGRWTSAPELVLNAMGRNPNDATAAVINTGLSLVVVPFKTKSRISNWVSFFNLLNSLINTMPFKTATPKSAINPIPAEMLKGMSRIHNNKIPPMAESGMAV